jgi:hypothetical protein
MPYISHKGQSYYIAPVTQVPYGEHAVEIEDRQSQGPTHRDLAIERMQRQLTEAKLNLLLGAQEHAKTRSAQVPTPSPAPAKPTQPATPKREIYVGKIVDPKVY